MRSLFPILGFALAASAIAQQPQPNPAVDPKNFGTLEGQVLNAITGEPVRRVNLALRPIGAPGTAGGGVTFNMPPPAPFAATTDADGKFRLEKVEPGTYRLMAERQGFVRQEYGARLNSMMGTTISVATGQNLKDVNFKMTPQAVVRGRVLDEEGEPLARAQLQILRRRYFRGKQQLMPMGGGQTIDTGEFRIADLAPRRYWISATFRSRTMMFGEAAARNNTGQPDEEYITTYYPNATEESGARSIELAAGQEMSGIDIPLRRARVFRVRGKVGEGAEPVRNMRVFLMPRDRGASMSSFGANGGIVKEDGTFEIGSVLPGSYYVVVIAAEGRMTVNGKAPVDVVREDVDNVTPRTVAPPCGAPSGSMQPRNKWSNRKRTSSPSVPCDFNLRLWMASGSMLPAPPRRTTDRSYSRTPSRSATASLSTICPRESGPNPFARAIWKYWRLGWT